MKCNSCLEAFKAIDVLLASIENDSEYKKNASFKTLEHKLDSIRSNARMARGDMAAVAPLITDKSIKAKYEG